MDLSLIDKLILFFKMNFSSFLAIEEFIIFLLILVFLLYNEKVQNKNVRIGLSFFLLFLFSLLAFLYKKDALYILTEIGKIILNTFYFPNLIFYIFTVFCSFLLLVWMMFQKNKKKWDKILSYVVLSFHIYLFAQFISQGLANNLSFSTPAKIYKHDSLFVIVQMSQILFLLYVVYRLVLSFFDRKLKKK